MNAYIILTNGTEREIPDIEGIVFGPDKITIRTLDFVIRYENRDVIRIELVNTK